MASEIRRNLEKVRERMRRAAEGAGRDPESIQLLAVSKTFPVNIVSEAVAAGQTAFGENRVQEGAEKIPVLFEQNLQWHLIGPLQSNKVKRAVEVFNVIQTVGREKIARKIDAQAKKQGKDMPVYVQINIGEEEQKFGVDPGQAAQLVRFVDGLENVRLSGLMAIPPYLKDPEEVRPYFQQLREMRDRLQDETGIALQGLSMGMSHDFEAAIEEGATLIRVGTAIFGPRR